MIIEPEVVISASADVSRFNCASVIVRVVGLSDKMIFVIELALSCKLFNWLATLTPMSVIEMEFTCGLDKTVAIFAADTPLTVK